MNHTRQMKNKNILEIDFLYNIEYNIKNNEN